MEWQPVIGLEVHVQLCTQSKIFSSASASYGATPNTQACLVDLGFPGILPVLNKEVVKLAIRFGLSIQGKIMRHAIFSRKNYFYPDLPKGYQISQYDLPIVKSGYLDIEIEKGIFKRVRITRAHLEEDSGKSIHDGIQHGYSGIDFNRSGIPLLEIVSEPDIHSAKEALIYLKTLHTLIRYIKISDANMQEGAFRCDVNISLSPSLKGRKTFRARTEIKNMNSFRFIKRAILFEISRQKKLIQSGKKITQETRFYDEVLNETRPMRTKEEAHDYRYFPDPDLLPLNITSEFIESIRNALPELPEKKRCRFQENYKLDNDSVKLLTKNIDIANYFEDILKIDNTISPKLIANWITGNLTAALKKNNLNFYESPINAKRLLGLLRRISDNTLSTSMARQIFNIMWNTTDDVDAIIKHQNLKKVTDIKNLEKIVNEVIVKNPQQVAEYRSGKITLFTFFVGQIMKITMGKVNPQQVRELLKEKL
ncbi:Asp-tRNA(Asn)/Glu-tRNA(Gln) amidotransferase subunit GatB [Coxiella endosymbiont of Amblyomma americanum]|uniref:Asp-tRNA(Asn)/Glu-tRNA(Gln) amidotransferase subunit GatB n=1 Tax=Coxiella endosymbiont of Amblyomma americanum TaxID=325775 RepID=UPI00057F6B29|nr:Asp-tRNA(Asn)/Glu-tRNA(Gln) amidotransferase subunit GatB [Coxiella endosymbiont of Amblyomma americanum]AJC50258.1 glutamyl-tRNA amidotransferase [Coxiella endosymbiont of Amblyomma americanum]AUJ59016.1 aspartyl/glutamyl-tRNA amidotransferase subunit B [Coxiella-like endosymbiont of Amblyomma americanum]